MRCAQLLEDGKITEEELDKLWSMYDMENIVDAALNDGKLAGRNEAIAARRAKAKTKKLTPVPEINGGGSTNETELPQDVRELNDIAQASKRSNRF